MSRKRYAVVVFVVFAFLAAVSVSRLSVPAVNAGADTYEKLKVFTEVLSVVERNYVEEVDTKELVYSAIDGMLNSLDPHSAFLSPEDYKEMQVDTRGEFGGLGIQISMKDNILTVIAPIEDTPAWSAGIKAGDKIVKIDGEPTKDMTIQEAVNKMRGPKGTQVTISIFREGWKEAKDFSITRDIIKIKSVKSDTIEDTVGYVKITQFQERTASDLDKTLKKLQKEGVTSLVLDLRNNPGGLLNSAVDVSGKFLPPGRLVVYIKSRDGSKIEYRTSERGQTFEMPMVVLVNYGSASASEIVAGALKDWKRAVVLGEQTFGKGSVQSVVPLSDGSGLRLTTARYYTPSGTSIQSTGIIPDITVKLAEADGQEAHPVLREKDLEGHLENEQEGESKPPGEETESAVLTAVSREQDTQLQRAVDLLKTWTIFKKMTDQPEDVPSNP